MSILSESFWRDEFAVTDKDVERLVHYLHEAHHPCATHELLLCLVQHKLDTVSIEQLDPKERQRAERAAEGFKAGASLYHPTRTDFYPGEEVIVLRTTRESHEIYPERVRVISVSLEENQVRVQTEIGEELRYMAGGGPNSIPGFRGFEGFSLTNSTQSPQAVVDRFASVLIPRLGGRLQLDARFVHQDHSWLLVEQVEEFDAATKAATQALLTSSPLGLTVEQLARRLDPRWNTSTGHFSLNRSLRQEPDHFTRTVADNETRWRANPYIVVIGERWITPQELEAAVSALLAEGSRFTERQLLERLGAGLAEERSHEGLHSWLAKHASRWQLEYVGAGQQRTWALQKALELPARPSRKRGTRGLGTSITVIELDETVKDSDETPLFPAARPWTRTCDRWRRALTFYEWENGMLSIDAALREMIPPLRRGQTRALIALRIPQLSEDVREANVIANSDGERRWLRSSDLKMLFKTQLVPGAYIDIEIGGEEYELTYTEVAPRSVSVLVFDPGTSRFKFEQTAIKCEVNEELLLAESRFRYLNGLRRLDTRDRRKAELVVKNAFEHLGRRDSAGRLVANGEQLFHAVVLDKPYSRDYLRTIIASRGRWPYFSPSHVRGEYVFDPAKVGRDYTLYRKKREKKHRSTRDSAMARPNVAVSVDSFITEAPVVCDEVAMTTPEQQAAVCVQTPHVPPHLPSVDDSGEEGADNSPDKHLEQTIGASVAVPSRQGHAQRPRPVRTLLAYARCVAKSAIKWLSRVVGQHSTD